MQPFFVALLAGLGFVVAYHTYGRWLGRRIFELSAKTVCPSLALEDGVDYVPTSKGVVFGHHFTSIAGHGTDRRPRHRRDVGMGPCPVMGGSWVHFHWSRIRLRSSGRQSQASWTDGGGYCRQGDEPKGETPLFLFILFMALTIVLAIFGLVIASVFKCILQRFSLSDSDTSGDAHWFLAKPQRGESAAAFTHFPRHHVWNRPLWK